MLNIVIFSTIALAILSKNALLNHQNITFVAQKKKFKPLHSQIK